MFRKTILPLLLLASTVVFAQDWKTNFDESQKLAIRQNKKILLVFSGSDWCAPCIKLKKEILLSAEFVDYSKENFVILNADFPKRKKNALPETQQKHNNMLAERYNKEGHFPLVVVLDSEGKVLGKTGYKKIPPNEYIWHLTSLGK